MSGRGGKQKGSGPNPRGGGGGGKPKGKGRSKNSLEEGPPVSEDFTLWLEKKLEAFYEGEEMGKCL